MLDNCEHVIGAAVELCTGLLEACDDVRMLATSREPLRIAGEARYRLGPLAKTTEEEGLLAAERHAALHETLTHLPPCCQQLIALLIEYPPPSNAQISARLSTPAGSIAPSRGGCLEELRSHPAMTALINPNYSAG